MSETGRPPDPNAGEGTLPLSRLKSAALHGVRWIAIAKVAADVVTLTSAVVLAHLIPPAEFGLAAVATVLFLFSTVFTGHSFGTPLVQRKEIDREYVQSSWFLSLAAGLVLTALTLALAPVVAEPFFGGDVSGLMQVLAPVFAISAFGVVPHALLQRELAFRRIAVREVLSIVAGSMASVGFALAGLDAEAIVLGALVKSLVFSAALYIAAPNARPRWHRDRIAEIFSFGFPTGLQAFVSNANRNVDYAILGAVMSPAQVGFYWRAFQLGVEYERKISVITARLALPVYSRTKDLRDMRRIRTRIVRSNATIIFPLLGTFIVVAPVFIPWAFGDAWEPAVLLAQILAVAGMSGAVNSGAAPLVLAAGRPKALLVLSTIFLACYAATLVLAAPHGLTVVCIAVAAAQLLRSLSLHYFLIDRIVGIPIRELWRDLTPATVSTGLVVAVGLPLAALTSSLPALPFLAVNCMACALLYLAILRGGFPAAWDDISLLVRRVLPARVKSVPGRKLRPRPAVPPVQ